MKKILLFLTIAISFGLLNTSCSDELDVFPKDQLTPETITGDDINLLITGVYSKLNNPISFWYLRFLSEDLSADNLVYRATFFQHGEVDNNAILASNVLNTRYYNGPYTIIQTANDVINLINESDLDMSEVEKNELLSEAKYVRAYAYFLLVKLYAGVPIIESRSIDEQIVPRNSEDEVWNYIIEDLKFVSEHGPAFSEPIFASKQSGQALLARVYLNRGEYALAYDLASELVSNSSFELADDYSAIWDKGKTKEHIFYANRTTTDGDAYHGYFARHQSMDGGGRGELPVDLSLINAYEEGDERKDGSVVNVEDPSYDPKFHWFCNKYRDPGDGSAPIYVSRIAEMYLIMSEASLLQSNNPTSTDVLNPLNTLRAKRGLGALTSADIYAIQHERRVELAFEGVRWTDMKRTPSESDATKSMAQVFVESKGRTINDLLYPIPTAAIDVNNLLKQNDGY